jgi:hypothetical protein
LGSEISGAYKINRIINEFHPEEIPIFGSSRAEGCYFPDSISSTCFNYGLSGTQDDVILFFLSEELKKNKTTPIIVNFDMDGLNRSIGDVGYYLYNSNNVGINRLLGDKYKTLYRIPFLKYYGFFEVNCKYYLNSKVNFTKLVSNGGSFEKNSFPEDKFKELVRIRSESVTVFHNDVKLKQHFFSLIRSTSRKIVIVIAPYHISFFKKFRNLKDFRNFKEELKQFENVEVVDMSQSIKADSLFFDTSHLNYKGAEFFSQQLEEHVRYGIQLK